SGSGRPSSRALRRSATKGERSSESSRSLPALCVARTSVERSSSMGRSCGKRETYAAARRAHPAMLSGRGRGRSIRPAGGARRAAVGGADDRAAGGDQGHARRALLVELRRGGSAAGGDRVGRGVALGG